MNFVLNAVLFFVASCQLVQPNWHQGIYYWNNIDRSKPESICGTYEMLPNNKWTAHIVDGDKTQSDLTSRDNAQMFVEKACPTQ